MGMCQSTMERLESWSGFPSLEFHAQVLMNNICDSARAFLTWVCLFNKWVRQGNRRKAELLAVFVCLGWRFSFNNCPDVPIPSAVLLLSVAVQKAWVVLLSKSQLVPESQVTSSFKKGNSNLHKSRKMHVWELKSKSYMSPVAHSASLFSPPSHHLSQTFK